MRANKWVPIGQLSIFFFFSFLYPQDQTNNNLSDVDTEFKLKNLPKLKLYISDSEQELNWKRLSKLCGEHEDLEIMTKILELGKKSDGIYSYNYADHIYDIFKINPYFFILTINEYYEGDFEIILQYFFSEATARDFQEFKGIIKLIPKAKSEYSIIKSFYCAALRKNDELQSLKKKH